MHTQSPRPIVLIILDGFGIRCQTKANAIATAHTPIWNKLLQEEPHTLLSASGLAVGLPEGQMGNSEVGHLTIGAGRVFHQDLSRITLSIQNGQFNQNPVFNTTLQKAYALPNKTVHILGLLSPGGIHSHQDHIHAMVKLCAEKGLKNIIVHAFLDGRDTPPQSAETYLSSLEALCQKLSKQYAITARMGSVMGRYYAMDRDNRFSRTKAAYELLTEGKATWIAPSVKAALQAAYARGETDEFIQPTLIEPISYLHDDDTVIFMNFRADRARQLSYALGDPTFTGFIRNRLPKLLSFVTLTEYAKDLKSDIAFPPEEVNNTLGEILQNHHLKQLRIAETEKYAHVTYFINGGRETPFEGEDRILVPSPAVATYDLAPEMSAPELTEKLTHAILNKTYDVIICNYANADMVGHTGNFEATVQAIEVLDTCLGKVITALKTVGGEAIITADHGNAELMFDEKTNQPHTAHTLELVPFVYVGKKAKITHATGSLSDITPTILHLLGIPQPAEMTGKSLVE